MLGVLIYKLIVFFFFNIGVYMIGVFFIILGFFLMSFLEVYDIVEFIRVFKNKVVEKYE